MSKLDSTESQDFPAAPKSPQTGKSAAASRILRAVEMGRTQQSAAAASQGAPVASVADGSSTQAPATTPVEVEPSQESLRSLSAATSATDASSGAANDAVTEAAPEDAPRVSATKAGLAAAKQAAAKKATEEAPQESPVAQAVRARAEAKTKDGKASKSGKHRKRENAAAATEPVAGTDAADLPFAAAASPATGFWAKLSLPVRIAIIAGLLAAVAGGVYFLSRNAASKAAPIIPPQAQFVPLTGAGGWNTKWAGDAGRQAGRSISAFRPSQTLANYRLEIDGQIENRAMGWVFRAQDPKNYYAYKLEIIKPGLEQLVALSRIVVINGVEAQHHYTPLKAPVRPGHTFRIRMDAKGSEFTTWIGGELVEAWQDDRLHTGAVGTLQDKDERAQLHKVQIFEMR